MKFLTLEQMQSIINQRGNPHGTIILEANRTKADDPLDVMCGVCNEVYQVKWSTLKASHHKVCPRCMSSTKGTKLSNDKKMKDEFFSYGYIPLFDKFTGVHDMLPVEDENGYKGLAKIVTLRQGSKMRPFWIGNPYALENLQKYSDKQGYGCHICLQEYGGRDGKIQLECECGNVFETSVDRFLSQNKFRCNECSGRKSTLEKKIELWLDAHNIEYKREYKLKECKNKMPLPFDFYIPSYGFIEVDGIGHYKPTRFNGASVESSLKTFKKVKKNDSIKNEYCKNHNISLLRLSYKEIQSGEYENILNSIFTR